MTTPNDHLTAARTEADHADDCLKLLKQAREHAIAARAPKLKARIDLAISSAKGAVRNTGYRVTRAYHDMPDLGDGTPDHGD